MTKGGKDATERARPTAAEDVAARRRDRAQEGAALAADSPALPAGEPVAAASVGGRAGVKVPYMPTQGKTVEHQTPRKLFDALDAEFGPFTCDPACRPGQYTGETILGRDGRVCYPPDAIGGIWTRDDGRGVVNIDGLIASWSGRVFLNPPYTAKMLDAFTSKAVAEIMAGNCEIVVALLPANKTEQAWWQRNVGHEWVTLRGMVGGPDCIAQVRWLPGRRRFEGEGQKSSATFASCVVVWRASHQ